jgi:hypothetical protein
VKSLGENGSKAIERNDRKKKERGQQLGSSKLRSTADCQCARTVGDYNGIQDTNTIYSTVNVKELLVSLSGYCLTDLWS